MERHVLLLTLLALALGLFLGWALGRRTNRARARLRRLESELEASRAELEMYRERVVEHFSRTSDLLRHLTIQYRKVYDHLADGARSLCPDETPSLGQGIEAALLSESKEEANEPEEAAKTAEKRTGEA